ncbi:MAG: permease [Armatimonadota bacterium]|nr:permease [Armatimonadota bacterium]
MKLDRKTIICLGGVAGFLIWASAGSAFGHSASASAAMRTYKEFLCEMLGFLPMMFLLVGIFDTWVPREVIERHVGESAGPAAVLWMILLAMLQAGPLYGAFPVAAALARKGCAPKYIFMYLGAFSAMKLPMLSFEVGFLGWRFSLTRLAFTLPVFIAIGYVMGQGRKCEELIANA